VRREADLCGANARTRHHSPKRPNRPVQGTAAPHEHGRSGGTCGAVAMLKTAL